MFRALILFFLLFILRPASGQNVTIRGNASGYAGKALIFYTFPEPISHEKKRLAETKVEADGTFQVNFPTDQTIEVYTDLEKFKGTLVVEPGTKYEITLPAWSPRTPQEAASPYFEPELYWLAIKDLQPTEINFLVRSFLTDYNKEIATHTLDLYQKRSADSMKAIVNRLETKFPEKKKSYFNTLKRASYGELEFIIVQPDKERIAKKYFASAEVVLSHPAYQRLFNSIYAEYLTVKSLDLGQKKYIAPALQGDFSGWVDQLTGKGYQKDVAELVAVKSFYDGYFSNKFDKKAMVRGLKEASSLTTGASLKAVLPAILFKITALQEGSQAPALQLKNQTGNNITLVPNGKFVYLAFFRSDSKACVEELDSLVSIHKKLSSVLTIITVSLDKNTTDAIQLWNTKKYQWELTFPLNTDKIQSDFKVSSTPLFYLISPDQRLLLSPALPPTHNFESLFLKIYRESRFRQNK